MREVPGSNSPVANFFFFSILWDQKFESHFLQGKKLHPFNTFQHTCHTPQGAFMAILNNPRGVGGRRKAAEIGLKCKINSKNALLLHRKNEKFHFFKNPSFKFENLLVADCPHVWVWKTSIRSLLSFFLYWSSLDEHGESSFNFFCVFACQKCCSIFNKFHALLKNPNFIS